MTTLKKLVFCSTCAVVLLNATPKVVIGQSLKNELLNEKKETNFLAEQKIDDSAAKLINLATLIVKYSVGAAGGKMGLHFLEKTFLKEGPKQHIVSSTYCGIALAFGGFGAMIWAIKGTFGPLFQKTEK